MQRNIRNEYIKFSLTEALFFAIFSITSYQTVFLQKTGLLSSQIGFIVSISSIVGLLSVPIWGVISDHLHTAKMTFLISILVTSILYVMLPIVGYIASGNTISYYIYIPFIFLFRQASNSMLDSWCISTLSPKGISYGSVRMWGSVGYSLISIVLGLLVDVIFDVDIAFYLILPLITILLLIFPHSQEAEIQSNLIKKKVLKKRTLCNFTLLLKNYSFVSYMIYALGLNIYLAVTLIYMPYIIQASNCQPGQVGLVTGIRALVEILTMYIGSKCVKKIPIYYNMIAPGILFGLEHVLYQYAGNLIGIIAIMILSGAAGGIFYSLGPTYIYEIVPKEVTNIAQSCNAMNMTIVSIIGSLVGGYVIKIWGIHALTTSCGILILALTAFFIITIMVQKIRIL